MADRELMTFQPTFPDVDSFDPERASVSYDEDTDTFIMYLGSEPVPAVAFNIDANHFLLVDPASQIVVGFQTEGFMRFVTEEAPMMLEFAEAIGVPAHLIDAARQNISPSQQKRIMSQYVFEHFAHAAAV